MNVSKSKIDKFSRAVEPHFIIGFALPLPLPLNHPNLRPRPLHQGKLQFHDIFDPASSSVVHHQYPLSLPDTFTIWPALFTAHPPLQALPENFLLQPLKNNNDNRAPSKLRSHITIHISIVRSLGYRLILSLFSHRK